MTPEREAAFTAMYDRHYSVVRAYLYRRVWPDAVDDLLAQTFMIAWRKHDSIPRDQLPWLLGTARKCLANHHRAAARGTALIERLSQQPESPGADVARQRSQRRALIDALSQLSEVDQELMLLSEWEGLGPSAAGRLLGLGPARARARLSRARRALRVALQSETDSPTDTCHPDPRKTYEVA